MKKLLLIALIIAPILSFAQIGGTWKSFAPNGAGQNVATNYWMEIYGDTGKIYLNQVLIVQFEVSTYNQYGLEIANMYITFDGGNCAPYQAINNIVSVDQSTYIMDFTQYSLDIFVCGYVNSILRNNRWIMWKLNIP